MRKGKTKQILDFTVSDYGDSDADGETEIPAAEEKIRKKVESKKTKPKNKITKDDRERIDENPKTNKTKTNKSKKKKSKKLDDTVAQLVQL